MKEYILRLKNTSVGNKPQVGAKSAFLGEIFTHSKLHLIRVPDGFTVTSSAFNRFIEYNKLDGVHDKLLANLDSENLSNIKKIGQEARNLILGARIPGDIHDSIIDAYHELCSGSSDLVAVRSSAIHTNQLDLETKDIHDTFLNISGDKQLIDAVKKCFASLYSDKALLEKAKPIDNTIAVCVQKMLKSDDSCMGMVFTSDPESGFADVIHIAAVYGLLGKDNSIKTAADQYIIYKPTISEGVKSIIQKKIGTKNQMLVFNHNLELEFMEIPIKLQHKFVLNDMDILTLAKWAMILEDYYGSPVSMEWAKDSLSDELYLLQARPEKFKQIKLFV
jgi:pyruvate,water dikinase